MAIYPLVLPNYACRRPIGWAAYAVMRGGRCGSLEHYARGGIRPCIKAAAVCETPRIAVAIHSSGELGIQLATMLHMSSVLPNLSYAADAHYHHLVDDVIVGGKLAYRDCAIEVPVGPGLGVQLDREKLGLYSELFKSMGGYQYDRDPERPGWFALVPNDRWHAVS